MLITPLYLKCPSLPFLYLLKLYHTSRSCSINTLPMRCLLLYSLKLPSPTQRLSWKKYPPQRMTVRIKSDDVLSKSTENSVSLPANTSFKKLPLLLFYGPPIFVTSYPFLTYLLAYLPQGTTCFPLSLLGPASKVLQVRAALSVTILTKLLTPRTDQQLCPLELLLDMSVLIPPIHLKLSIFKTKSILFL